jgi:P27 family predicted phage terminase small subunit
MPQVGQKIKSSPRVHRPVTTDPQAAARRGNRHAHATRLTGPTGLRPLALTDIEFPPDYSREELALANDLLHSIVTVGAAVQTDRIAVRLLISTYVAYSALSDRLLSEGLTYERTTKGGDVIPAPHPLLGERGRLFSQLTKMMGEFGLTPFSRRGVVNVEEEPEDEDEWGDVLN